MTREEFEKYLDDKGYSHNIDDDDSRLVLDDYINIVLDDIDTMPSGVVFRNRGNVWIDSITDISPGVHFENEGNVILDAVKIIPPGVVFNNSGRVNLASLLEFTLDDWEGHIKGVNHKHLLNLMIKKGLFI
jgi:hypothetical protein